MGEQQVAVYTEKIRFLAQHLREAPKEIKNRIKLITLVTKRRKLMDSLASRDLDKYLAIREKLKIRHVYRLESLIGRLPSYLWAIRWKKAAPGAKRLNKMKKSQRLYSKRVATMVRKGVTGYKLLDARKKARFWRYQAGTEEEVYFSLKGKDC